MSLHKGLLWLADGFEKVENLPCMHEPRLHDDPDQQRILDGCGDSNANTPLYCEFKSAHQFIRGAILSAEKRKTKLPKSSQSSFRTHVNPDIGYIDRLKKARSNNRKSRPTTPARKRSSGSRPSSAASIIDQRLEAIYKELPLHPDLRFYDRHSRCHDKTALVQQLLPSRPHTTSTSPNVTGISTCTCCGEITSQIIYKYAPTTSAMTSMMNNKTFLYPDTLSIKDEREASSESANRRPRSAPARARGREYPRNHYVIRGDMPHFCNFVKHCPIHYKDSQWEDDHALDDFINVNQKEYYNSATSVTDDSQSYPGSDPDEQGLHSRPIVVPDWQVDDAQKKVRSRNEANWTQDDRRQRKLMPTRKLSPGTLDRKGSVGRVRSEVKRSNDDRRRSRHSDSSRLSSAGKVSFNQYLKEDTGSNIISTSAYEPLSLRSASKDHSRRKAYGKIQELPESDSYTSITSDGTMKKTKGKRKAGWRSSQATAIERLDVDKSQFDGEIKTPPTKVEIDSAMTEPSDQPMNEFNESSSTQEHHTRKPQYTRKLGSARAEDFFAMDSQRQMNPDEFQKPTRMQAWMNGRLALSKQACRFELPIDMRHFETMTPLQYLARYCVVSSRRKMLYDKVFYKHRDPKTGKLSFVELQKALGDVLVESIDDDRLRAIVSILKVPEYMLIDKKLFMGIAGFAERYLYPLFIRGEPQSCQTTKEGIECADFCGLEYKFHGININSDIRDVLQCL